ncbi:hypothetical protein KIPB_009748, partial [Kipferlia bialata]
KGVVVSGVDMCGWDMQGVNLRDAILSGCNMAGAKVRKDRVVGATLPEGDKAPTVTPEPKAMFEVAQGVTESVVNSRSLGSEYGNWNPVTLLVPSVDESKTWTLTSRDEDSYEGMYVCCDTSSDSNYIFYNQYGTGVATCTRSGSTITFSGPAGTVTHPCTPGQEARVTLQVHRGDTLTLTPQ